MIWFYITFGTAVVLCFVLLKVQRGSGRNSSREKIARVIADFIEGKGQPYDWDDFTSHPLKDPALDMIRKECVEVCVSFPAKRTNAWCSEAGLAELRKIHARCLDQT